MPLPRNPAGGITTHECLDFGQTDRIEISEDGVFEAGGSGSKVQRLLAVSRRILSQSINKPAHKRITATDAV